MTCIILVHKGGGENSECANVRGIDILVLSITLKVNGRVLISTLTRRMNERVWRV